MSEQSSRKKALRFAAVLSLVCSFLITAASAGLKHFQLENMELDRQKNILRSVGLVPEQEKVPPEQIKSLYKSGISEVRVTQEGEIVEQTAENGDLLTIYFYMKEGKRAGYIVPIQSRGLWGKILGYLAFENDGSTVAGFTVYSHSETPGLGGEIESQWFRKNFKGKKIINKENQFVSVGIAKGAAKDLPETQRPHYVDGISGATLTGKYLSQGIRSTLEKYEPVSVRLRQKRYPQPQSE